MLGFFHVDIKKDVPCNRIAKPDDFHSRYVPPKKDLTEKGFTDFTNQVLGGKISVRKIRLLIPNGKYN